MAVAVAVAGRGLKLREKRCVCCFEATAYTRNLFVGCKGSRETWGGGGGGWGGRGVNGKWKEKGYDCCRRFAVSSHVLGLISDHGEFSVLGGSKYGRGRYG